MKVLSRDEILNCQDLQTETVDCPEWGGAVIVRPLSGAERDRFEQSNLIRKGKGSKIDFEVNGVNIRARLCYLCIVDESGKRLFTEHDVDALGKKNSAALNRVFEVAQRLSGLTKQDIEELEEVQSSENVTADATTSS